MAAEANVLINIKGKPYVLSKHLKKSNLIEIITKLQEDLTKIKLYTKSQINCKEQLEKLKLVNQDLQSSLVKNKRNNESQTDGYPDQTEIRKRMKENFEKKARYTSHMYEEKIDLLKKQLNEIEKERESSSGVIETKQTTISNLKRETEHLKKAIVNTELQCKEAMNALRQRSEGEWQRVEKDKQKIAKEMEVLQRSYIDLDKIRKYLEKNNASLKASLAETNLQTDERILSVTKEFEKREEKHLSEIKTLRKDVELIVEEADSKISKIEEKMRLNASEHQGQITRALKENDSFRQQIKTLEQKEESYKNEIQMNKDLIEKLRQKYETSLQATQERYNLEIRQLDEKLQEQKFDLELKIFDLQTLAESQEKEVTDKMRKLAQLEADNDFLNGKLSETKALGEENNKKYLDSYNILRAKVEAMKQNYDSEKDELNGEIFKRDQIIDNFTIQTERLEKQINTLMYANDLLKQENGDEMDKIWMKISSQKDNYLEELDKVKENHNKKLKLVENDLEQSKVDYEQLDKNYQELLEVKQKLDKKCEELRETLLRSEQEHRAEIAQIREDSRSNEKHLRQDFEAQTQDILAKNSRISTLESELCKQRATVEDLQENLRIFQDRGDREIARLKQVIEENSQFHKNDLETMKQLLAYKEQTITELDENLTKQQQSYHLSFLETQNELKSLKLSHEQKIHDINAENEAQKQKYDVLIYEFYKELKEQQNQADALVKIKSNLEMENSSLKKRNSDFILSITKQKEKFKHDSELLQLLDYLVT